MRSWSQAELMAWAGVRRATLVTIKKREATGIEFTVLTRHAQALSVSAGLFVDHRCIGVVLPRGRSTLRATACANNPDHGLRQQAQRVA